MEELPSSSRENYDYQIIAAEKLSIAKRKLGITKLISSEVADGNETTFEDFNSYEGVLDTDFTIAKENGT